MTLSILVPVKDEAESIQALVDEVLVALPDMADWELVFIDDGSTDATWDMIQLAAREQALVRGVRCRRNGGKSQALAVGLAESRGEIIVTLDGDLQDDPAEIPGMLAQLDETDLVAGHKATRRDPLSKRLPSRLFNAVTSLLTGLKLRDHNCGLKAGYREVFEAAPLYGEMHRYLAAIVHAEGYRVVEYDVNHRPRRHGRSKFGFERYLRGALDLLTMVTLTRFGRRPGHLFGGLGVIAGVMGSSILLYLAGIWFLTDDAIGDRPLLLLGVLLLLLGVQLVSFGLIAEMLVNRDARDDDPRRHVLARVGGASTTPVAAEPSRQP